MKQTPPENFSSMNGNRLKAIIKDFLHERSFNYLPYYLKPYFLYLGNYPEDHQIEHKTLVRQWIEEGFVKQKVGRSVEEVAQGYLNELVNRSLLSPVTTNDDGSIKTSRIHDFYREIILPKSRDQNFVTSTNQQNMTWPRRVRHLSVHGSVIDADKLGFVDAYPGSIALKEIAMMTELRRVSIKS
ncbi:hypothetical protein Fot_28224 [Forsythia ovata]|uniref:Disease resistance protein winged helix domain-containing protein n=1 Tax=Forsythia ovata TaxID=205694 RepID=A0ABD1TNT4_9LAMI